VTRLPGGTDPRLNNGSAQCWMKFVYIGHYICVRLDFALVEQTCAKLDHLTGASGPSGAPRAPQGRHGHLTGASCTSAAPRAPQGRHGHLTGASCTSGAPRPRTAVHVRDVMAQLWHPRHVQQVQMPGIPQVATAITSE
jgi:hypothetical protein